MIDRRDIVKNALSTYYESVHRYYYESFLTFTLAAHELFKQGIAQIKWTVAIEEQSDTMTITQPMIFIKNKMEDNYYINYGYVWVPEIYMEKEDTFFLDNWLSTEEQKELNLQTLSAEIQALIYQIVMIFEDLPLNLYGANNSISFERSKQWEEQKMKSSNSLRENKRIFVANIEPHNITEVFKVFSNDDLLKELNIALVTYQKEQLEKHLTPSMKSDTIRNKI